MGMPSELTNNLFSETLDPQNSFLLVQGATIGLCFLSILAVGTGFTYDPVRAGRRYETQKAADLLGERKPIIARSPGYLWCI